MMSIPDGLTAEFAPEYRNSPGTRRSAIPNRDPECRQTRSRQVHALQPIQFPRSRDPLAEGLAENRVGFATRTDDPRPKYYVLEMFPYPSGRIHMGHVRNYAMGDVVARYKRAKGFNVLHPMGWDAFGMPAENARDGAARSIPRPGPTTISPRCEASSSRMGLSLDWAREIATCDPELLRASADACSSIS